MVTLTRDNDGSVWVAGGFVDTSGQESNSQQLGQQGQQGCRLGLPCRTIHQQLGLARWLALHLSLPDQGWTCPVAASLPGLACGCCPSPRGCLATLDLQPLELLGTGSLSATVSACPASDTTEPWACQAPHSVAEQ